MNAAAFFVGLVGPMVARLLAALGVTLVTTTGAVAAFDVVRDQLLERIGGFPVDVSLLAGMMGVWESIGITLGAVSFVIAWSSTAGFVRLAKA